MTSTLEAARIRFISERDKYEETALSVAESIKQALREKHVVFQVSSRAKTVASFVKKALAKNYTDPWTGITDKAGVRIVFDMPASLDIGLQAVREVFPDAVIEDDRQVVGNEDRLKYPKVHAQVTLQSGDGTEGLSCEIQLRTAAQDLWSKMSHALLYKPTAPASADVRRSLYRLLALVELYDSEVERGMTAMANNPDYREAQLLQEAEAVFHTFVASDYQIALSQEVMPVLSRLIDMDISTYRDKLTTFVSLNREKLIELYQEYGPESDSGKNGRFPLAGQPESVLIFERLTESPELLRSRWARDLPADWLTEIASVWGIDL
ncbi:RelA/SpoT domain-containing protein [Kitasatospora saccharophila]|uniref:RelA/SpoT domain-containing protein n=1 Tax=Kitasatospora saccharophila TaxID=407973 RepID=A0ABN2X628_9ACTN